MKKAILFLTVTVLTVIYINSCEDNKQARLTDPAISNTNPAMSNPDKLAWDLFIQLNQPAAENPKLAIWETWALAQCVFDNPDQAPTWKALTEKNIEDFETLPLQQISHLNIDPKILFDPNAPTRNETRINRDAFDFIVKNNLYNAEGLESYYAAYPSKKIDLPIEAKEIKAIWAVINAKDTGRHHYAIGKDGKTYYGLKGIHIVTKDIPNWFWSTFEHIDNFAESEEFKKNKELLASKDSYGYDSADKISESLKNDFANNKMSGKWKYYRLRGTQTDFTDPMGKPIVLANTKIEDGFMLSSSCMTCHSRATVGAMPAGFKPQPFNTYYRLDFFKEDGQGFIGSSLPKDFFKEYQNHAGDSLIMTGKPNFIQTDFMWSFFRAKRKGEQSRTCK